MGCGCPRVPCSGDGAEAVKGRPLLEHVHAVGEEL
jgi:hypothetical protein